MGFSRAKPAGWTDDNTTITATEINTIDTNMANAVDKTGDTVTGALALNNLTSTGLGDTTSVGKFTLDSTARLILGLIDVNAGSNVTIRDIDAASCGVLYRVDNPGSTGTTTVTVKAATTANVAHGEAIIIFMKNPASVSQFVAIASEGGASNPLYTLDHTPSVDSDWVMLAFDTTLTGSNPDGEWIVVAHGNNP